MSKGYVYILSNPSMPGIVKIGKTTRTVEQRCYELFQTGVPTPFDIVAQVPSPDCHELEQSMHEDFEAVRVSQSREFFRCAGEDAVENLHVLLCLQVQRLVDEYLLGCIVTNPVLTLMPERVQALCKETGRDVETVTMAMNCVRAVELAPALARVTASQAKAAVSLAVNNG